MENSKILTLFRKINVWKRGDERAPHKPLLILFALGKCNRGEDRLIPFTEADKKVRELLIDFGPPRQSIHPEYPFWRLQNDSIWEISPGAQLLRKRQGNNDALKSELIKYHVSGGFTENIYRALQQDKVLLNQVVETILDNSFPASIHSDILTAVGLDIQEPSINRKRDPTFQSRVFIAYGYCCAICGFDVRLNNISIGIEAAHIKWHQAGGPDTEDNGLTLCVLHHKLFDRGAFTFTNNYKFLASQSLNGTEGLKEWLLAFHNQSLRMPQSEAYKPNIQYIEWHRNQVFQGLTRTII